jgi:CheY-like chemotaxis protein
MQNDIMNFSRSLNILCVEDDASILEIYKELFGILFNNVYLATNGMEGLEIFQKEKVDLILTDYCMPCSDGLQMSRKIREKDSVIPIILVTALENAEILREALVINITSFLKKPFTKVSLLSTFSLSVKSILAERLLLERQSSQIYYSTYQENLTFEKENTICKNELISIAKYKCDVFYEPKDILSGDSFILKKISPEQSLVFLVDGMGKGISAATTAMLSSSFVNYYCNKHLHETLILSHLCSDFLEFITPNLLEDEALSASFLLFDTKKELVEYAIFSMPPVLYQRQDEILKLKSNNTPISSFSEHYITTTLSLDDVSKILIYSDGLNENSLKNEPGCYVTYLQNDFKRSNDLEHFEQLRKAREVIHEDDVTYIYLYNEKSQKQ